MNKSLSPFELCYYGIRSAFFYLGYGLSAFLYAPIVLLVGVWLPFKAKAWFINRWSWFVLHWLRFTCGIVVDLKCSFSIETLKPCLVLSNHQSSWEALYLQLLFCPSVTVVKKELLNIPFFGWGLRLLNPIVIDRTKPRVAGKHFLEQGQKAIQDQKWVVLFPEGTRVAPGERKSASKGGFRLAVACDTPIIPVYHNAGYCWPPRKFLKFPGTITCIIGEPLHVKSSPQELALAYGQALNVMESEVSL